MAEKTFQEAGAAEKAPSDQGSPEFGAEHRLIFELFKLFDSQENLKELLSGTMLLLQQWLGNKAAAVRLKSGSGFSPGSSGSEGELMVSSENGEELGTSVLAYACGKILRAEAESRKPPFTDHGSFWANSADEAAEKMRGLDIGRPHPGCRRSYESVALIPIRAGSEIIGVLQLCHPEKSRFTAEMISLLERIASSLGLRLAHIKAMQELADSEERFRLLIENFGDPVFVHGADGRFTTVNRAACRATGYTREELLSMHVEDIDPEIHTRDDRGLLWKRLAHGQSALLNVSHRRKDGSFYPGEAHLNCLTIKGEPLIVAIVRDMTARERSRRELLQYQEELKSLTLQLSKVAEQERRKIASFLHDEVCQLLATSRLKLGLLLRNHHLDEDTAAAMKEIDRILAEAVPATRSIIFEISSPALYELGLRAAIESLAEVYTDQYLLKCEVSVESWTEPKDEETRILLFQCIQELLVNVRRHARAKSVRIQLAARDGQGEITVEDDGEGFDYSSAYLNRRALEAFGLFALREKMKFLGGVLELDSRIGRGTKACLHVPLE